jgi:hypothetical protein
VTKPDDRLRCARCGAGCCRACAFSFSIEAFTYCRPCGETVLEGPGTALSLGEWDRVPGPSARPRTEAARPWLIVVARDQPDLYAHLVDAFAQDDKVEILVDRRRDGSRNPPAIVERLRTHGAALVRRTR